MPATIKIVDTFLAFCLTISVPVDFFGRAMDYCRDLGLDPVLEAKNEDGSTLSFSIIVPQSFGIRELERHQFMRDMAKFGCQVVNTETLRMICPIGLNDASKRAEALAGIVQRMFSRFKDMHFGKPGPLDSEMIDLHREALAIYYQESGASIEEVDKEEEAVEPTFSREVL